MKKILNACLLLFFQLGYLEWGKGQHLFIFQATGELFSKALQDPWSVLHPLILLPFVGEMLILYTLFQQSPSRILTLIGLFCMSTIMVFLFLIGGISLNFKIFFCAMPFIVIGILVIRQHWKKSSISF